MSGQKVRENFMRRFMGLQKYSRAMAWLVVGGYVAQAVAGIAVGDYLLSLGLSWATVLLMVATSFFIGTRLRGLNNIVHECTHSSFSDYRPDNVTLGRLCSALLTGCFKTYKEDHLSHHSHLGDYEHDNEMAVIEKFGLHEPLSPRTVLRHFITPLLGRHLPMYSGVNLSRDDGAFFFGFKIAILVAFVAFTIVNPWTSVFFLLVPVFYIFPTLNFWTDCLDHAGLVGETDELRASRNILAPAAVRYLFFPLNDCYHLVHHLFPQIPARHLDKAHAELCTDPDYGSEPLASSPTRIGLGGLLAVRKVSAAPVEAQN